MNAIFAFGYAIASDVLRYPGAINFCSDASIDLQKNRGLRPDLLSYRFPEERFQARSIRYFSNRDYEHLAGDALIMLQIKGVVTFAWNPNEYVIQYDDTAPHFSDALLQYWLLHTVIPLRLTLQNAYHFIHSGCVEWQSRAIVLTAPSHHGKSTMTHHFLQNGHTLIGDDMTGFRRHDGTFQALPSYPYHRHYRKVEDLGTFTTRWACGHRPVHAVFALQPAAPDAPVEITQLRGMQAFEVLRGNSTIDMSFQRPQALHFLGEMAQSVPVYRLQVPWDLKRLPEVRTAVLEQCEV